MIIVEGMDGSGKSTLVAELLEVFPVLAREKSPGPVTETNLGTCLEWLVKAIKNPNPFLVYDRYSPISERVYGPVLRTGDRYGTSTFDLMRLTFRRQHPLLIYCRPPIEQIRTTVSLSQQMGGVREHVDALVSRYDWFMNVLNEMYCVPNHYLVYDWTSDRSARKAMAAVYLYVESNKITYPV